MPSPTRSLPSTPVSDRAAIRALRLTSEQFLDLAAGYGDPAAIGVLRDGQLAKRRLLLRVLADAGGSAGDTADGTTAALELLTAADVRVPAAVEAVLGQPHLDAAATGALRGRTPDSLLAGYAAASAALAGIPFRIRVPTHTGRLHLPALGTALGVGPGTAVVEGAGAGITVTGSAATVVVPAPFRTGTAVWWPLRRLSVHAAGHRLTIDVDDLDPGRDCYQWPIADRLDDTEWARLGTLLAEAWRLIVADHPRHAAAMSQLLRSVVPLSAAAGNVSAASRRAGGAVALAVPADAPGLALLMLHEFAHMKLNALLDLVDLHPADGPARHRAPWRIDPRPVGALLQGTYAHLAVADFWRRHRRRAADPTADLEFAYWLTQSRQAAAVLAASGELTGPGTAFVARLAETLRSWHADEQVPPRVRDAVADLSTAAAVRWHLVNLRPGAEDIAQLVAQWTDGHRAPTLPAARWGPAPAPGPAAGSEVARSIRRDLTDHGGQPRPVDDIPRWTVMVTAEPADPDAWAGLAVALGRAGTCPLAVRGLTARPDLVRALPAHLPAGSGTPVRVAAWIGSGLPATPPRRTADGLAF